MTTGAALLCAAAAAADNATHTIVATVLNDKYAPLFELWHPRFAAAKRGCHNSKRGTYLAFRTVATIVWVALSAAAAQSRAAPVVIRMPLPIATAS